MAHKKGLGSSKNGRDSTAQRLGVKVFGGQIILGGGIIVRQRGTPLKPGANVGRGKDDTLFAKVTGTVLGEGRGDKILVFKLKRKKQYKKMQGHRQNYVEVKINEIVVGGKSFKADKK